MLDDKLVDYISAIKSPFEEEDLSQEELAYDGYMRYFRDCMIKSIGTSESSVMFQSYWDEFIKSCDEQQKKQFIKNLINKIIKHYKMSFLTSIIEENDCTDMMLIELINFIVYKQWLQYFPKCLSFIDEKILFNKTMLKIFLTSDYDNFISKLDNYKRCNILIREYFKMCAKNDGIETLSIILNDDILGNYIEQFKLKVKNEIKG